MSKVMIVTGASRGIGAATAKLAASKGFAVCVNYKSHTQEAQAVVEEIQSNGGIAIAVKADVTIVSEVNRLFTETVKAFGGLHALVNNAGILETQMRLEDMSSERIERIYNANVFSPILCIQAAIKIMSTRYQGSGGSIVNVSSVASRLGSPREYVDYAASKGAIDTLTIGLAKELAIDGIRVNAVRPGCIDTDIHASSGEPNRIERVKHLVPMQRGGTAAEVASAIVWLASDESSYTSASFIEVAGGN
ncbi:SDR family oxidoreductase [Polynucleobacter necessarius]|uniref:SDR family oxidoreductase n=1 Tax=Polynucleobacter necessarius TaxID=576610 RepID=UPI000E08EC1A|nr:SDR family oxidoreductase [Polynucleobacter necessarius]